MKDTVCVLNVPIFSDLCNLGFRLRREVFVGEQGISPSEEFDADDLHAAHLVAVVNGDVCGVLRIVTVPEHVKIGRVAVARNGRGKGIGAALIMRAMADHGPACNGRFHLSAQADKTAFYARFGFTAYGEPFLDVGMPHVAMKTY